MRVKAVWPNDKSFGFYDNQRKYNGDEFNLKKESHFSKIWMEWVIPPVVEEKPKRGRPKKVEAEPEIVPATEVTEHGDSHLQES